MMDVEKATLVNWDIEEIVSVIDEKAGGQRLYKVKYVTFIWQPESSLHHLKIYFDFWEHRKEKSKEVSVDKNLYINEVDKHNDDHDDDTVDGNDDEDDGDDDGGGGEDDDDTTMATDTNDSMTLYQTKSDNPSSEKSSFEPPLNEQVINIFTDIGNFSRTVTSIQQVNNNDSCDTLQSSVELSLCNYTAVDSQIISPRIKNHAQNDVIQQFNQIKPTDDNSADLLSSNPSNLVEIGSDVLNVEKLLTLPSQQNLLVTNTEHSCHADVTEDDIDFQNRVSPEKLSSSVQDFDSSVTPSSVRGAVQSTHKSPKKSFVCSICSKVFSRATTLRRHVLIHSGEKPFHCECCDKSFNQKSVLQRHTLIHTNQKKFTCEICGMKFLEKCALQRHKPTHGQPQKKWVCEICCKSFILKEYLTKHKLIHSKHKPYKCSVCTKSFSDSSARRRHEKTHEANQQYACYICKTTLKNPASFKRHLLSCERKIAKCYICNISFEDKNKFEAHVRFHGNKRYSCQICNLSYDSFLPYNNHLLMHKINRNTGNEKTDVLPDAKDRNGINKTGVTNTPINDKDEGIVKTPRSFDELFKTALSNTF